MSTCRYRPMLLFCLFTYLYLKLAPAHYLLEYSFLQHQTFTEGKHAYSESNQITLESDILLLHLMLMLEEAVFSSVEVRMTLASNSLCFRRILIEESFFFSFSGQVQARVPSIEQGGCGNEGGNIIFSRSIEGNCCDSVRCCWSWWLCCLTRERSAIQQNRVPSAFTVRRSKAFCLLLFYLNNSSFMKYS